VKKHSQRIIFGTQHQRVLIYILIILLKKSSANN